MSTRSLFTVAAALCVAGCASGSASQPTFKTVAVEDAGAIRTTTTPASQRAVDAPIARVFAALGSAYTAIGVDVDLLDPAAHRIGSASFARRGHMNGEPVSRFANCGTGMTGQLADTRRVVFSVVTTATAVDATHTALVTVVDAYAVDVSGSGTDRVSCGSTGALEQLLYRALQQQLGTT
jgi:hypothetical protein